MFHSSESATSLHLTNCDEILRKDWLVRWLKSRSGSAALVRDLSSLRTPTLGGSELHIILVYGDTFISLTGHLYTHCAYANI